MSWDSIWEHLLVMPLCPSEVKFEYEKFLRFCRRPMIGLSFLLIEPSFFEAANGISPASMFRCLSRRADLSLASPVAFFSGDEAEIAILQPLRNVPSRLMRQQRRSLRIALRDVSAQNFALLKGNDHLFSARREFMAAASLQYPDRSTVVAKNF